MRKPESLRKIYCRDRQTFGMWKCRSLEISPACGSEISRATRLSALNLWLRSGVRHDSVFVLVVDLDSEKFCDLFRRPHFNGIPRHPLADVDTDLAADAFVESYLHVRDNDVHAI